MVVHESGAVQANITKADRNVYRDTTAAQAAILPQKGCEWLHIVSGTNGFLFCEDFPLW